MTRAFASDDVEVERLRALVQSFVRRFGLLLSGETPCGQPVSRSYAHALMVLLDAEADRLAQAELGATLGIDKSNVARLCARMERLGHAVQVRAEGDGRSRVVSLTAKGKELARSIERSSQARFRGILRALPKKQRPVVFAGLEMLAEAVLVSPVRTRT